MDEFSGNGERIINCVKEKINNSHFCIIGIGGVLGSGKTTLARYLSWKLDISQLETDLFLFNEEGQSDYDYGYIHNILCNKKKTNRNVVVEGCSILKILSKFDPDETFLIYVKQSHSPKFPTNNYCYFENTEKCSVTDILDYDKPADLQENAQFVVPSFCGA